MSHQLQLRPTFDRKKQSSSIANLKNQRHKGYLKDMLVSKFIQRNGLDTGRGLFDMKTNETVALDYQKSMRIQSIINKEFDRFIDQQSFTQKNLQKFEGELKAKLCDILKSEGFTLAAGPSSVVQKVPATARQQVREKQDDDPTRKLSNNLSLPQIHTSRPVGEHDQPPVEK